MTRPCSRFRIFPVLSSSGIPSWWLRVPQSSRPLSIHASAVLRRAARLQNAVSAYNRVVNGLLRGAKDRVSPFRLVSASALSRFSITNSSKFVTTLSSRRIPR